MSINKKKLIILYISIFALFPTTTYATQNNEFSHSEFDEKPYTTKLNDCSEKPYTTKLNDCSFPKFDEPYAPQNNNSSFLSIKSTNLDGYDNNHQFFNSSTDDNIEKLYENDDLSISSIENELEKNFYEEIIKNIDKYLNNVKKYIEKKEYIFLYLFTKNIKNTKKTDFLDNEIYILKTYINIIDNYQEYEEYIKEKYKNENFFNSIKEKFDNFFNKNIDELKNKIISHYDTVKKTYNEIYDREKEDLLEVSQNEKEKKHIYNFEEIYNKITDNAFSKKSYDRIEQGETIKMITKNLENMKKTMLNSIIIKTSTNHFIKNIDNNDKLKNKIEDLKISLNTIEKYKEYKNYIKKEYKNKEYFNLIEEIFDLYDKMIEIIKKQYIKNFKKLFYKKMEQTILSSINKNLSNFKDEILNLNKSSRDEQNINTKNLLDKEIYILKTYLEIFDKYKKYEEYIKEEYKNENFFNSIKEKFDNFFNKNINELKDKIIFHYNIVKKIYNEIYDREKEDLLEVSQNEKEKKHIYNFEEIYNKITDNAFSKKSYDRIEQNETIKMITKNLENIKKRMLNFMITKNSINNFIKNIDDNDKLNNKIENLEISLDAIEEYKEYKNYIKKEYKNKKYFNLIEKIFDVYDKMIEIVKEKIINSYNTIKNIYMKICIEQKENFPKYRQLKHLKQKIKKIIPEYKRKNIYINIIDDETFEKKIQEIILESIGEHLKEIERITFSEFSHFYYDNLNFIEMMLFNMQTVINSIDIYEKYKKDTKEQYKSEKYFNEIEKKFCEVDESLKDILLKSKIIEYYEFTKEIYKDLYNYINKVKGPYMKIEEFENRLKEIDIKLRKIAPEYDKMFNTSLFKKSTREKLKDLTFMFISKYFHDYIKHKIVDIFQSDIKQNYLYLNNFTEINIDNIKPENLLSNELIYIKEILEVIDKYKKFKEYTKEQYKNEEYFNQIKEKFDYFDMLLKVPKEKIIYFYEFVKKIYEKSYNDIKIINQLKDTDMKEFEDKFLKTGDTLRKIIPEYDKIFNTNLFKEKTHDKLRDLTFMFISEYFHNYIKNEIVDIFLQSDIKQNYGYINNFTEINIDDIKPENLLSNELIYIKEILEVIDKYKKFKEYIKEQYKNEEYFNQIKEKFDHFDMLLQVPKKKIIYFYEFTKEIYKKSYNDIKIINQLEDTDMKEFEDEFLKTGNTLRKIIPEYDKIFNTNLFKEKTHDKLRDLAYDFIYSSISKYRLDIITHVNNYLHRYENQNLNKINTLSFEKLAYIKLILKSINEYEKYKEYTKKQYENEDYLNNIEQKLNRINKYVKNTKNEYISYYNNIKEIFNLKYKNPKEKLSESEQEFKENIEKNFEEIDKIIQ